MLLHECPLKFHLIKQKIHKMFTMISHFDNFFILLHSRCSSSIMSKFTVYISPPTYLEQWLRHEFWDVETSRVKLPRGSSAYEVLKASLQKTPTGYVSSEEEGSLPVSVPSIKGIDMAKFCFVSESGKVAVVSACKNLFRVNFINELKSLFVLDVPITDVVYNYMDRHGIERTEQNWEAIRQMFYRQRKKDLLKT